MASVASAKASTTMSTPASVATEGASPRAASIRASSWSTSSRHRDEEREGGAGHTGVVTAPPDVTNAITAG